MPAGKWLDRSQPQTLMIATILLYVNAVFGVINGELLAIPLGTIFVVGQAVSGWGIANEKKWAYWLAVVLSVVILAQLVRHFAAAGVLSVVFQVAMVALLVHPQSRNYKRLWFR